MSELNQAQREALLASADKHEEAADDVKVACENLREAGYEIYAAILDGVVVRMIRHVDEAREIARKK